MFSEEHPLASLANTTIPDPLELSVPSEMTSYFVGKANFFEENFKSTGMINLLHGKGYKRIGDHDNSQDGVFIFVGDLSNFSREKKDEFALEIARLVGLHSGHTRSGMVILMGDNFDVEMAEKIAKDTKTRVIFGNGDRLKIEITEDDVGSRTTCLAPQKELYVLYPGGALFEMDAYAEITSTEWKFSGPEEVPKLSELRIKPPETLMRTRSDRRECKITKPR